MSQLHACDQAKTIFAHEEDDRDVITGFEQKTNYGRPNWDDIFSKVSRNHPNTHVGVFFCGVAALSHVVSAPETTTHTFLWSLRINSIDFVYIYRRMLFNMLLMSIPADRPSFFSLGCLFVVRVCIDRKYL